MYNAIKNYNVIAIFVGHNHLAENLKWNGIDVFQHLAICSGLSMLNAQNDKESLKGRGNPDSDQNQNMYNLTKLGMKTGAKIVSFENAPGAYTKMGKPIIDKLKEIANSYNYSIHLFKTDTLLHGIPQSRKRTFINFYKDSNPGFFNFEKIQYTKLNDYLKEINESMLYYNKYIQNTTNDIIYEFVLDYSKSNTLYNACKKYFPNKSTTSALQITEKIGFDKAINYFNKKIKETNLEKYKKGLKICTHCKNKKDKKMGYWDSTANIANNGLYINSLISKNMHRTLHPTLERGFNIREMLHLMGMPHDFKLSDYKKRWQMISQNVPVKTATFIGLQINFQLQMKNLLNKIISNKKLILEHCKKKNGNFN